MFTGIITDIGSITLMERKPKDVTLSIAVNHDVSDVAIGASVSCNGACLTVIEKQKNLLKFDASFETLEKTTLKSWKEGTRVNIERAMKSGDEYGGHIVSGHVDGIAKIASKTPLGDSYDFIFRAPEELKKFIAAKGSVTLNGVSLTVNEVNDADFRVTIIRHTLENTVFGNLKAGDEVNIEADVIARYVARMLEVNNA